MVFKKAILLNVNQGSCDLGLGRGVEAFELPRKTGCGHFSGSSLIVIMGNGNPWSPFDKGVASRSDPGRIWHIGSADNDTHRPPSWQPACVAEAVAAQLAQNDMVKKLNSQQIACAADAFG